MATNGRQEKPEKPLPHPPQHWTTIRPPPPVESKLSESWKIRSHKPVKARGTYRIVHCLDSESQSSCNDPPPSYKSGHNTPCVRASSPAGLGIQGSPSMASSLLEPRSDNLDKRKSSTNIAQRIEGKLWEYSAHGNVFKKWILEISSWLMSAACMGTIIIVLLVFKVKKPSDWPLHKSGISLNVFMATLSRLSSAALLLPVSEAIGQLKWIWFFQGSSKKMWDYEIFDNASRGPWGSFQLLVRTKGQRLAALGAAIVLLALALDPFFQPVLDFPTRWTEFGISTIPRVIRYDPDYVRIFVGGKLQSFQDGNIHTTAKEFFYKNGTQTVHLGNGTGIRPEIPLSCPTSNCTWPDYQTLGFCSECVDISHLLDFACLNTRIDWVSTLNSTWDEWNYPNGSVCGYFLNATSELPMLMSGYLANSSQPEEEVLIMRTLPLLSNPLKTPIYDGSVHFKDQLAPVIDFFMVTAADGPASVYRNETPVALECIISWCVQTMKSAYYEGQYKEEILRTFVNRTEGPFPFDIHLNTTSGVSTRQLLYNITLRPFEGQEYQDNNSVHGDNLTEFTTTGNSALATLLVFEEMFPSFVTVTNTTSLPVHRRQVAMRGFARTSTFELNPWTSHNNITRHVQRMCTALTNTIRSSSSSVNIFGKAYITESFVAVRWEWLSLPLALLAFSFIFLLATMIKTAHQQGQVGVYKTSGIAALLHGLPDDMQKKIAAAQGTPRTQAREMKVKLLPKMGWRVSERFSTSTSTAPKIKYAKPPPGWI